MRVDDFDFNLPESVIALEPARPRDSARLLHVKNSTYIDKKIIELPDLLREGDLLVANNTKVIPAQLKGLRYARNEYGSDVQVDVTLHKDISDGEKIDEQMWRAFIRPAKRLKVGDVIEFGKDFRANIVEREGAEAVLCFEKSTHRFREGLLEYGAPPLPPYIARKRSLRDQDSDDYQTHFASEEGSVAAPTAGLHFTDRLLAKLKTKTIGVETITLHVGAGTFLPMTVDDTNDHKMHSEWGDITQDQADRINAVRANGGRIFAVGTTSLRLLESAVDDAGRIKPFRGETDIFITPGYEFRGIDGLMTNFHLPRSTLFMLVCALSGTETMKAAYAHAINVGYRFYSYGDACLLER